jgi:methyltransferase family protein
MEPLIGATAPRTILEVGVFAGDTTALLLEYAERNDAVVHAVDTVIKPPVDELAERYGERLVLHRGSSLDRLPGVGAVDVAILDGDHNWYTVFHELRLLGEAAADAQRDFPVTFLHDVGWPFGRRDQYHDPDSIPAEYRHPHRLAGMVPGEPGLSDEGGIGLEVPNAEVEGTPRNGVLTGVEDFMAQSPVDLTLKTVTGFHGLGILVSDARLAANDVLRAGMSELDSAAWLEEQCRRLERGRVERQAKAAELRRKLRDLRARSR